MKTKTEFWNGMSNKKGIGFSLFPILIYSKYKRFSTFDHKFEIGIFFWSMRLKWVTMMK